MSDVAEPVDNFLPFLMNTLKNEGGFVVDVGGATNYGVRQDYYDVYTAKNKLPKKNVKELKFGDVRQYYKDEYYNAPKINEIPYEKPRGVVFDFGVNAGSAIAIKKLQTVIGAKSDGIIGKDTLKKLDKYVDQYGEDELGIRILEERQKHYNQLVKENPTKYKEYQNGWNNRIKNNIIQYNLQPLP